jgi:hypothetical protein
MAAITYTSAGNLTGPTFTCSRCKRVYPYPPDQGRPIRCECGWWYYNLGHGRIMEEFKPRIGGASGQPTDAEAATGPAGQTEREAFPNR